MSLGVNPSSLSLYYCFTQENVDDQNLREIQLYQFFFHSTQNQIALGEILEKIELVSFENTVEVRTNT